MDLRSALVFSGSFHFSILTGLRTEVVALVQTRMSEVPGAMDLIRISFPRVWVPETCLARRIFRFPIENRNTLSNRRSRCSPSPRTIGGPSIWPEAPKAPLEGSRVQVARNETRKNSLIRICIWDSNKAIRRPADSLTQAFALATNAGIWGHSVDRRSQAYKESDHGITNENDRRSQKKQTCENRPGPQTRSSRQRNHTKISST